MLTCEFKKRNEKFITVTYKAYCNHTLFFFLKNVLTNDKTIESTKLQRAFEIIKKIITSENECNETKTLLTIWEMLPIYLGSFCCKENLKVTEGIEIFVLINSLNLFQ